MPEPAMPSLPGLRFLSAGRSAVLVEVADGPAALALFDALAEAGPADVVELVPAARTVLVRFRPGRGVRAGIIDLVRALPVRTGGRPTGAVVEIPVVYDGEDLAEVASMTGMTVAEVVARHIAPTYDVAFTGFAPGFAYLTGGDALLEVPRRASPRTAIPAGAVGVAGPFSGVYPRRSPGGWQLLGRTAVSMWDLDRTPPALLLPGSRVRFVEVDVPEAATWVPSAGRAQAAGRVAGGSAVAAPVAAESAVRVTAAGPRSDAARAGAALEVLAPGVLSLVEDLGRPGHSALGVSGSGALDRAAFRRANRLLGNTVDAAAIEHVGGGLELLARGSVVVAVTGASGPMWIERQGVDPDRGPLPTAVERDRPLLTAVERDRPLLLRDGEVLVVGPAETGVVAYVGVLGGLDVPPVLGSRATDVLSGLGPDPLRAGSVLPVGTATTGSVSDAPEPGPSLPSVSSVVGTRPAVGTGTAVAAGGAAGSGAGGGAGTVTTVDVTLGPRDGWFAPDALEVFTTTDWLVTPQSNRVGSRLAGPPLERAVADELPSEATVAGAVQVPADGQPVVFLADHPVTGGYPVIAVVVPEHLGRVAQCPPGAHVRFTVLPEA